MIGLFKQEIKTLFKSPASLSVLIIPIVLLIGLGYLIPSAWIIPSSITIGIVGAVLLYFGGSLEEIKRTSFMKSISLTKLNKFTFLLTKVLFSVFISIISILWVLFVGWFLTDVWEAMTGNPLLATSFANVIPAGTDGVVGTLREVPFIVDWTKIDWPLLFYSGVITIILAISLAFIFVTFSKTSLSFYLMSFGYLISMILFGGVVMPSFLVSSENAWFKNFYYIIPNYYTNGVLASAFGNGLGSVVEGITNLLSGILGSDEVANASVEVSDNVKAFLSTWDGSNKALTEWYNEAIVTFANNSNDLIYINYVYELFATDYSGLIEQTLVLIETHWGPVSQLVDKLGALNDEGSWTLFHNLIGHKVDIPVIGSFDFGKEWNELNLLEKGTWTTSWTIAKPFINNGLYDMIVANVDGLSSLIDPIFKKYVVGSLVTNIELNQSINSLFEYLNEMFGTSIEWYFWVVPWIESIAFLSIASIFFKWS